VKIARARVYPIALPLRAPLATAHETIEVRRGALLVLECDDGRVGLGEATPIAGFGLESHQAARAILPALAGLALGCDPREPAALRSRAAALGAFAPCARGALDSALLDLEAQAQGIPVAELLARRCGRAMRDTVSVSALLRGRTLDELVESARVARDAGFTCAKLKLGAGPFERELERVAAARESLGSGILLRLDANGIFPDAARALEALERLAPFAIELVEQPVPAAALAALASLRDRSPIRIAADESAVDPDSLERVLRLRAADVIVLKPSALGGATDALAAAARARSAGLAAFATTLLDGAVARAAALAVAAALPEPLLACGLATGDLLARDLADVPVVVRGEVALSRTPGLGVVLDDARLASCSDGVPLEVAA